MTEAIDRFLTLFIRQSTRGAALSQWPEEWPETAAFCDAVFDRVAFHGVALIIAGNATALAGWPAQLQQRLRNEARAQSFWELGHRQMLVRLIVALNQAGIASAMAKGTALAYTLYCDPAVRRRGDSDVLLPGASRSAVRKVLTVTGLRPVGDTRPLQETWACECPMGFTHAFDLHWRSNASAVISRCLDRAGIGSRTVPLDRLDQAARAVAPTDNLILIAINRALHCQFGYTSGGAKAFADNRLIWALDLDLQCAAFNAEDWQRLTETACASGTSPVVLSALAFAQAALGTVIPAEVTEQIARQPGDAKLLRVIGTLSGLARLRLDLSACPTVTDKLRLTRYAVFPGVEVLHERFPKAAHWPISVLQLRRLLASVGKLIGGHA